mgnify:CR=1 FL=1
MALWFVKTSAIVATPADTNDGKDPLGFDLSSATWTASTKTLAKTGGFSGYTHTSGDIIWISSATAGTDGWYEIASKDSDDQLTLGDLIEGSGVAADQTDVTSSDGPFATIGHLLNDGGSGNTSLAGDDDARICDDGTHEIASQVDITASSTATTSRLTVKGVGSRGEDVTLSDPNNRVHVRAATTFSSNYLINMASSYIDLINMWLDARDSGGTAKASRCVNKPGSGNFFMFFNIRVSYASNRGISASNSQCFYCEADNNNVGIAETSIVAGCIMRSNTSDGCTNTNGTFMNSVSYNNGGIGFKGCKYTVGCTAYGNAGDGFEGVTNRQNVIFSNNSSIDNGGYGFNLNAITLGDNNHTHNNTSGATNLTGGLPGVNNVTGDPLFADAANGDFTPQSGSPLIDAGLGVEDNNVDIGAVEAASGGGGGTNITRRVPRLLGAS